VLVDAGLNDVLAVAVGLVIVVLVCWFICGKVEPAIRRQLKQVLADFGGLAKTAPRLPVPVRASADSRR